ncbi:MAG: hypothetical protein HOP15_03405 [Planctomycetes bacterium]|nr:hypothetical protein [Planctomycetota bacterium]
MTRHARAWSVLLLVAFALLGSEPVAQVRKVSPPSRLGPSGTVGDHQITPDGRAVVYLLYPFDGGDQEISFFVASDAGARRLASAGAGSVAGFAISPDSRFLVFWKWSNDALDLFSVPLDGSSAPRLLTPPDLRPSSSYDIAISAQGWVVLLVEGAGGRWGLHAVSLTGGQPPVRLDESRVRGASTRSGFLVSPDGNWVAYIANQENLFEFELFLAPVTGAFPARKLNGPLVAAGGVHFFRFSPNSKRVVYRATQDRVGSEDLHSAAVLAAEPPIRLNPDALTSSHVDSFEITPDGTSVVYRHYRTGNTTLEIFRVPIEGGAAPTRLNAALVAGGKVWSYAIAPDGSVVYTADQEVRNRKELYHATNGGAVTKLNAPLAPSQDVEAFQLAPVGSRILFSVYGGSAATFLATLDGSVGPLAIWPSTRLFSFAPSGERVVFRDGQSAIGGLFSLLLDGASAPVELMHAEPGFYPATYFQLGLSGERLVSGVATASAHELFAVPIAGGAAPQRLSAPLPMESQIDDVWSLELSPDGRWTVFGFGSYNHLRLFSADLARRSAAIQLSDEATPATWFLIAPDGGRVVFRSTANQLYSVPIDGSAPQILIDIAATTQEIRITPDGSRVLYLDAQRRLHSAALDGTSPPVLLGGFPALGSVLFQGYRISADSARVVYHFKVSGETEVRLLSAPIDGSGAPVQLDPSLATDRLIDVAAGDRVVFQTLGAGLVSLWSVPADGSTAPTLLATEDIYPASDQVAVAGDRVVFLVRFGGLFSVPVNGSEPPRGLAPLLACWSLEAPGERVFFVGVPTTSGGFADLYSVPADGSAAPVRLSRASSNGYFTRRVSPGGARVVYVHEQGCTQTLDSTASDGSAEPVRLTTPLADCDGLLSIPSNFQLSADGRTVAFEILTRGYLEELDYMSEIFAVPSDGSRAPLKVNAPPPAINDYTVFRLDPAGRFVLYTGDQDDEDVHELYLAPLPRLRERGSIR